MRSFAFLRRSPPRPLNDSLSIYDSVSFDERGDLETTETFFAIAIMLGLAHIPRCKTHIAHIPVSRCIKMHHTRASRATVSRLTKVDVTPFSAHCDEWRSLAACHGDSGSPTAAGRFQYERLIDGQMTRFVMITSKPQKG